VSAIFTAFSFQINPAIPELCYSLCLYYMVARMVLDVSMFFEFYALVFDIADDNFTANRERVFGFCEKVAPLDIAFRISARVKPLDLDMLKAMKDAGLKEISLGVESFDDNVLKLLNKKSTVSDNCNAIWRCFDVGIKTRLLLMIGTPGQNKKTIHANAVCLKHLEFDWIACTHFVPLPGTDIYDNSEKYGIKILDYNLGNYNFYSFDKQGRRKPKRIFELIDRDMGEFDKENEMFLDWLESTGKLNKG